MSAIVPGERHPAFHNMPDVCGVVSPDGLSVCVLAPGHAERHGWEGSMPRSFMVEVSTPLLRGLLGEWSEPVQVMVEESSIEKGGYRMTFRRYPDPAVAGSGGTR